MWGKIEPEKIERIEKVIYRSMEDWNARMKMIITLKREIIEQHQESLAKKINPDGKESKPQHQIQNYQGSYTSPIFGDFIITAVEGNNLEGRYYDYEFSLKHKYFDYFILEKKEPFEGVNPLDGGLVRFNTDRYGNVSSLSIINDEGSADDSFDFIIN